MHIMHVHITIKPEFVEEFIAATMDNASNSVKETGVARFDVIQQADDATKFVLVEVYHSADDVARHKQTDHYNRWAEKVAHMFAEDRTRAFYRNVFPDDSGW